MKAEHIKLIASELNLKHLQVENTMKLLSEKCTIPFISRYRKEATDSLDEVQISAINDKMKKLVEVEKRRETILKTIEEQGKLSPELKSKIEATYDITVLEDLYLPYKPKKRTKASIAREKGLEPLANIIFEQKIQDINAAAKKYLNDKVENVDEALQGARDIIAERISEDQMARNIVRRKFSGEATIKSKMVKGKEEEGIKYKDYFDFEEPLRKCPSHRLLAMKRGEEEEFLRVKISPPEENVVENLDRVYLKKSNKYQLEATAEQVSTAIKDSYKRLLQPSIETEFNNSSKEAADVEAIKVFASNLRQLLLSAPLGQKRVLAIDPGFRSGYKIVCLDAQGNLLTNSTIYPHPPQKQMKQSVSRVENLIEAYAVDAIAIGNGTASRETEQFIKRVTKFNKNIDVYTVSENGASIYSASEVAREEFPEYDVTVRGAVSIGRRLMDPLAELVKIDPKSIGVGQYQHAVNQAKLKGSLDNVVESCVNIVGVNLNTASKQLLTYVSGLGAVLAQNIVKYRKENGAFNTRKELLKVPRMGAKSFEQSAGFLRIPNAKNPLDNSAVHPESYAVVGKMAKDTNCTVQELVEDKQKQKLIKAEKYATQSIGLPTLIDIVNELSKPGRDPRAKIKKFEFDNSIKTIEDVNEGMVLPGIINNITKFGAFIDIGIKQNGLVHISEICDRFITDPSEEVSLHQHVKVKVLEVDEDRGRIQLSLKQV